MKRIADLIVVLREDHKLSAWTVVGRRTMTTPAIPGTLPFVHEPVGNRLAKTGHTVEVHEVSTSITR